MKSGKGDIVLKTVKQNPPECIKKERHRKTCGRGREELRGTGKTWEEFKRDVTNQVRWKGTVPRETNGIKSSTLCVQIKTY